MQTIKCSGERLHPRLFIKIFAEASKLSPPRFMTLRLHPCQYKELHDFASIPETIELGTIVNPLGLPVTRVQCVRHPSSIDHGIAIKQDLSCDRDKLHFQVHGIDELIVEGLYYDPITDESTGSNKSEEKPPLIN